MSYIVLNYYFEEVVLSILNSDMCSFFLIFLMKRNKRMSNVKLIEKNWRYQSFDFLSLKKLSLGQFLESSNPRRYHWFFKNFFLQIKNHRSGSKIMSGFSINLILKGITVIIWMSAVALI